jgi:anti-anti-sigma regulatory factor
MSIKWRVEHRPEQGSVVVISGKITEEAEFQPIIAFAREENLLLDLAGVEQINSCGVREFIHFTSYLSKANIPFSLLDCSPVLVRQLNMISNFAGDGVVRSVLLPYFCEDCGQEMLLPCVIPEDRSRPPIEPLRTCEHCGQEAEFDDVPELYLGFLA